MKKNHIVPHAIDQAIARKTEIRDSAPARHTNLRQVAESISRRSVDQAAVELLMESLSKLVELCFEEDAGGPCNIDAVTGRILIPLPFGRAGYARWQLRPSEANILRAILMARQHQPGLFLYDKSRRSWQINRYDYDAYEVAMNYLVRYPITVGEFRQYRMKVLAKS